MTEYILVRGKTYLCKRAGRLELCPVDGASPMMLFARLFGVGTDLGYLQNSSPHHANVLVKTCRRDRPVVRDDPK